MKIILNNDVYKDLVYEANIQGISAAALVSRIVNEYTATLSSSHEGANQKEGINDKPKHRQHI